MSVHDPASQRAIGHVQHEGAEVLVEHRHPAAGSGDADHLPKDRVAGRDVQEHRDRERDVERRTREWESEPVAVTERRAVSGPVRPALAPGDVEERAARIDADRRARVPTRAATSRVTTPVPQPTSSTRIPGPDSHERQEPPTEPRLPRLLASGFEDPRESPGVRLPVDRPVWVDDGRQRRAHASALPEAGRRSLADDVLVGAGGAAEVPRGGLRSPG